MSTVRSIDSNAERIAGRIRSSGPTHHSLVLVCLFERAVAAAQDGDKQTRLSSRPNPPRARPRRDVWEDGVGAAMSEPADRRPHARSSLGRGGAPVWPGGGGITVGHAATRRARRVGCPLPLSRERISSWHGTVHGARPVRAARPRRGAQVPCLVRHTSLREPQNRVRHYRSPSPGSTTRDCARARPSSPGHYAYQTGSIGLLARNRNPVTERRVSVRTPATLALLVHAISHPLSASTSDRRLLRASTLILLLYYYLCYFFLFFNRPVKKELTEDKKKKVEKYFFHACCPFRRLILRSHGRSGDGLGLNVHGYWVYRPGFPMAVLMTQR
jgi:hypothetical protein